MSQTIVTIQGQKFIINDQPTYPNRTWQGHTIEGLLLNARLVQGIFDDLNAETRHRWDYPDGPWDAQRNTREFVAAMPIWREHGMLAFTLNLQGGSPEGYSKAQPWHNSAFRHNGSLREDYLTRLAQILDEADRLGMVVFLGLFYFGQDQRLDDEAAIRQGITNIIDWLAKRGDRHVIIEIGNETNLTNNYTHDCFAPENIPALIELAQSASAGRFDTPTGRLLVGTSHSGGALLTEGIIKVSDVLFLHGNGVGDPNRIREMVQQTRAAKSYHGQPIVFNEDDHFDFDKPDNNFIAAVSAFASWGYFDYRMKDEGFEQGYQCMPCDWGISSQRKQGFFQLMKEISGF